MNTGVIILLVILILAILVGIAVGLYFLLRPSKTPSPPAGCTGPSCTGTSLTNLIPVGSQTGCTGINCCPGCFITLIPNSGGSGASGTTGPTGSRPTSWVTYTGGIDLNNISEHDGITSLVDCQILCASNPSC